MYSVYIQAACLAPIHRLQNSQYCACKIRNGAHKARPRNLPDKCALHVHIAYMCALVIPVHLIHTSIGANSYTKLTCRLFANVQDPLDIGKIQDTNIFNLYTYTRNRHTVHMHAIARVCHITMLIRHIFVLVCGNCIT